MRYQEDDEGRILGLIDYVMEDVIDNIPETTVGETFNKWRMLFRTPFKFDSQSMIENDRQTKILLQDGIISRQKIEKETRDLE